ncbi:MAG: hypothetical protein H6577_24835 [Lewinellaceae bacterium]|nr:hypothetical protein [Saprospiraceae bacterium]MCB9341363.1 hypothetical protein [Lewinellaceae bacterium]
MTFLEQLHLWQRMSGLIKRKATGPPEEFAKRLGLKRTALFRHLETLRSMGADIRYCRERQSYFFETDFEFRI